MTTTRKLTRRVALATLALGLLTQTPAHAATGSTSCVSHSTSTRTVRDTVTDCLKARGGHSHRVSHTVRVNGVTTSHSVSVSVSVSARGIVTTTRTVTDCHAGVCHSTSTRS